ncbi:V-type ATP synthase subunit D [Methanogenium marinum]|uniref:V-type ATP synthase subunit D n=1 Tax=Methanogenium marinum TaxID=348610 RepID=UPI003084170E
MSLHQVWIHGVLCTYVVIDETASAFEELLVEIVRLAETGTTMKRLLSEIESTKRCVNEPEFMFIPSLSAMGPIMSP